MTLPSVLPTSIEVNSRFDGSNCALPWSSGSSHQRRDQREMAAHRIVGAVRIGDVALLAVDDQRAVLRAAAADLDGVAELVDVAGLAEHAMVEFLAALRRPFQQLDGAVDRDAFLVAGDQERDRALWACRRWRRDGRARRRRCRRWRPSCRPRRGRTARRPSSRRRTRRASSGFVAGRHHVGVAGEHQMRRSRCRCGRRGCRRRRCRARRRSCGARRSRRLSAGVSRTPSAPPSAGVTEGQRRRSRAMATASFMARLNMPSRRCASLARHHFDLALLVPGRPRIERRLRRERVGAEPVGRRRVPLQAVQLDEGPEARVRAASQASGRSAVESCSRSAELVVEAGHDEEQHQPPAALVAVMQALDGSREIDPRQQRRAEQLDRIGQVGPCQRPLGVGIDQLERSEAPN